MWDDVLYLLRPIHMIHNENYMLLNPKTYHIVYTPKVYSSCDGCVTIVFSCVPNSDRKKSQRKETPCLHFSCHLTRGLVVGILYDSEYISEHLSP